MADERQRPGVRLAFNLYTDGTPSVDDYKKKDEQISECRKYSISNIFCCGYAMYFWQGIQLRYPEYCRKQKSVEEIVPTEDGTKLIGVLPDAVKSPQLMADWENALALVAKGELHERRKRGSRVLVPVEIGISAGETGIVSQYSSNIHASMAIFLITHENKGSVQAQKMLK